jgi:hypothetical protein
MSAFVLAGAGLTLANQAVTLTFINPPAAPSSDLIPKRFWIGQSAATTYTGNQRVQINTQVTAFPTLVSATPAKLWSAGGASVLSGATTGAAGTSGVNASAEGAGAKTVIWPDAFSPANGWLLVLTPDEEMEQSVGSASGLGMHLPVAATTLTNWTFGMSWVES